MKINRLLKSLLL